MIALESNLYLWTGGRRGARRKKELRKSKVNKHFEGAEPSQPVNPAGKDCKWTTELDVTSMGGGFTRAVC